MLKARKEGNKKRYECEAAKNTMVLARGFAWEPALAHRHFRNMSKNWNAFSSFGPRKLRTMLPMLRNNDREFTSWVLGCWKILGFLFGLWGEGKKRKNCARCRPCVSNSIGKLHAPSSFGRLRIEGNLVLLGRKCGQTLRFVIAGDGEA